MNKSEKQSVLGTKTLLNAYNNVITFLIMSHVKPDIQVNVAPVVDTYAVAFD